MSTTNNPIPQDKTPIGDICIPVFVPNDQEWLWMLAKAINQPSLQRWWYDDYSGDADIVRHEWDSRVYQPLIQKIFDSETCGGKAEDNICVEHAPYSHIIEWIPHNPFTEPEFEANGWDRSPWTVANIGLPFWLDWFESHFQNLVYEVGGVKTGDVMTTLFNVIAGLQPGNPFTSPLQGADMPGFNISLTGTGTVELHFVTIPFGGKVIYTVDEPPSLDDVFSAVFTGNEDILELNRDLFSIPPEFDAEAIEEIEITTPGTHTIYVRFIPSLNDSLDWLQFGGGLRKVVVCGFGATGNVGLDHMIRFNAQCMLQYSTDGGATWLDVEGWSDNAALCFQGANGQDAPQETTSTTFTLIESNTQDYIDQLNTDYDNTPQSIGANIPTTAPNATEQNALCYALEQFVELYAVYKTIKIQQKNALEISFTRMYNAARTLFNRIVDHTGLLAGDDLFSCIVSDTQAIAALSDDSAVLDVACCMRDSLDGVTISETTFNTAIDDCVASLTGNAGDIACLMDNDLALDAYLMFLEAYNVALQRQIDGETLTCNCAVPSWCNVFDFTASQDGFGILPDNPQGQYLSGQGFGCTQATIGPTPDNRSYISREFGVQFTPDEFRMRYIATAIGGGGNHDIRGFLNNNLVFFHDFGAYVADATNRESVYTATHTIDEIWMIAPTGTGATPDSDAYIHTGLQISGTQGNAPTTNNCP